MELADFIHLGSAQPTLRFLVIGGYESLFLKYGTRELYDTFLRLLRHP